ncbi:MAG TPA: TRAP transporter fused permease subunit [Limnochordales bacterium]
MTLAADQGPLRRLQGWQRSVMAALAVAMTAVQTYTAIFGAFEALRQRSVHLTFALMLVLGLYRWGRAEENRLRWWDWVLVALGGLSVGYIAYQAPVIVTRFSYVEPLSPVDLAAGLVALVLLLEATRRAVGPAMAAIALAAVVYGLAGHRLPGEIGHRYLPWTWVVENLFFTHSGVLGIPLGVSATVVFSFIFFGKLLERTGAGQFFIDLACALMGRYRGGPAKVAVVASSLMGTLSGSAVANVVTTGTFTIPLMKRLGYPAPFAAAVEAVASSGGQIMPPVMGATAFIIASLLGIPYIYLAAVAAAPAVLYYLAVFLQVHGRACRLNLTGLPPDQLPRLGPVLRHGWPFLLPPALLVVALARGYTPVRAALWASAAVAALGLLKARRHLNAAGWLAVFEGAARDALQTAIATAAAGVVVGMVTLSGVGLRFSSLVGAVAAGQAWLALVLVAATTIVLGMGLPTVAAYIVQVALTVPALTAMGVPPLAAHLFVFYFASISAITPPVALAAFAGAAIAGTEPMRVGWIAFRLGFAAFLAPFLFVYRPGLLLQGGPVEVAASLAASVVGVAALASAVEGYLAGPLAAWQRWVLGLGGVVLVAPGWATDLAGALAVAGVALARWKQAGMRLPVAPRLPQRSG